MNTDFIPAGFTAITPFIMVPNAMKVIEFAKNVFDAEEVFVLCNDDGTVAHAQIKIGDALFMLADTMGAEDHRMPAALYVYVDNADEFYHRALQSGAESILAPANQFYGDRNAGVRDSCGNVWWIAERVEDMPATEMARRGKAWEHKQTDDPYKPKDGYE